MTRTWRVIAAIAIIVVPITGWVVWQQRDTAKNSAAPIPTGAAVNPAVPDAKLLQDASDIDASRRTGETNFSYVPKEQPPNLLRMNIGGQGAQVTDTYQFGSRRLSAVVVFTAKPASVCSDICVRKDTPVPTAAGQPATNASFQYVTVSFTGNVRGAPSLDDPATATAKKFWADVTFVPAEEATWFTDLVTRAWQSTAK